MPTKARTKRGPVKAGKGPPRGRKLPAATIERIRNSINAKLAVDTLHSLCENGGQHDGVRATAALGLLQFVVPKLAAVEHKGDGGGPVQFVFEKVEE
jgi:hypothetical protein